MAENQAQERIDRGDEEQRQKRAVGRIKMVSLRVGRIRLRLVALRIMPFPPLPKRTLPQPFAHLVHNHNQQKVDDGIE